jgi:hypothetical protein
MWLLILEALAALALLGGAVWWTMFSGRRRENVHDDGHDKEHEQESDDRPPPR